MLYSKQLKHIFTRSAKAMFSTLNQQQTTRKASGSNPLKVVLSGNIGVGKTTVGTSLSENKKVQFVKEPYQNNEFLELFYKDIREGVIPSNHALQVQLCFLKDRFDNENIETDNKVVVFDRSVYETDAVFGEAVIRSKFMSEVDIKLYRKIAADYIDITKKPDLIVYLKAEVPTLVSRIKSRGRDIEAAIDENYLTQLNVIYDEWFEKLDCKKVEVKTDEMNQTEVITAIKPHIDELLEQISE